MAIQDISKAILDFNKAGITDLVKAELDSGMNVNRILKEGLIGAMDEVGKRFSEGVLYVPEMLRAAQTMKTGLEILRPHLVDTDIKERGTIVIGTVKGDLHDIGKNLVFMMLEGAGFNVLDLGVDVESEGFVEAAKSNKADIVAMSALLTTTMPMMQGIVDSLKENGMAVKTIVGGAPVTKDFADSIGADGYAPDAAGAVTTCREFMGI